MRDRHSLLLVDDAVEEVGTLQELQHHLHLGLGLVHLSHSERASSKNAIMVLCCDSSALPPCSSAHRVKLDTVGICYPQHDADLLVGHRHSARLLVDELDGVLLQHTSA